jgi:hypothetical protein
VDFGDIIEYITIGTDGPFGYGPPEQFVVNSVNFVAAERHELGQMVLLRRIAFQPVGFLCNKYFHILRIVSL